MYDDTDATPGSKFNTHDLIGMPWQIIISSKLAQEGLVELKNRRSGEVKKVPGEEVINCLKTYA